MAQAQIEIVLSNGDKAGETLKELRKQAATLNKEINNLKPGTDEFVKKSSDLEKVGGRMDGIRKQIKGTTEASEALKETFTRFVPFSGQFQTLGKSIMGNIGAVGGLARGFGILKAALISTGIGALVVLLGSLVTWFQKTERGGDALAKIMAAIGAGVSVLTDRVVKLVDAMILFTQGDWTAAAEKFGEATKGVTQEIILETKAAWQLADALDQLEEQESKMILVRSRIKDQIAELRLQSKDESLSMAQRAKALEQTILLTRQLAAQEEQIARQRAVTALGFATEAEVLKHYGVTLDELIAKGEDILTTDNLGLSESVQADVTAAFEALAKLSDVRKQGADEERTIITELNTLKRKDNASDDQALKDQQKKEQEALKEKQQYWEQYYATLRDLEDKNIQAMSDSREKDLSQLKLNLQREIESIDENAPFYAERVAAAQELARKKRDEINANWDAKDVNDQIKSLELQLEADNNKFLARFLNRELNEQQFAQLTAERTLQYEQQRLDIIKKAHGEQSAEYQKAYAEFLQLQKGYADESANTTKQLTEQQLDNVTAALGVMAGFMGSLAGLYEEGTAQYKAFATAQAIISTIQGAINAFTSASAIAPFLGPIAAAAALASGYARVAQIQKTKLPSPVKKDIPKKERGGLLSGRRHSQGGILIEAEDGEFVFSRKAVNAIGEDTLTRVNNYYTRRFEAGGPVNPFSESKATTSLSKQTMHGLNNNELPFIRDELRSLGSKLDAWPTRLKVINVVTETEEGIKTVNKIRDEADV